MAYASLRQLKWFAKEPNSQSPKNCPRNSTYSHTRGCPYIQAVRGSSNQPHLFFAARTISASDLEEWVCSGGMNCFYVQVRVPQIVLYADFTQIVLYMPDYLPTKFSEGVCLNSTTFDVGPPGVSPSFSGLPSGVSEVLRCSSVESINRGLLSLYSM